MAAVLEYAPWLVCADGRGPRGPVLGYAYASRHRDRAAYQWSVDVSVYVHERPGGKGSEGRCARVRLALLHLQGFCAAHAGITLPNEASVGVHECLGFRPVGVYPSVGFKLGAWREWAGGSCRCASGRASRRHLSRLRPSCAFPGSRLLSPNHPRFQAVLRRLA